MCHLSIDTNVALEDTLLLSRPCIGNLQLVHTLTPGKALRCRKGYCYGNLASGTIDSRRDGKQCSTGIDGCARHHARGIASQVTWLQCGSILYYDHVLEGSTLIDDEILTCCHGQS